jgi:hypothetical protein
MISRTEAQLGIQGFMQSFLKLQSKLSPYIRHNLLWHSMQTDYPRHIQLYYLRPRVGGLDRYKVSNLGQSIHNHPNGIIARLHSRQSHDKIHGNRFPLPLRHLHWLQQPSRSLMLSFDSLTSVAMGNILDNVSLHTIPPISGFEIMVHLISSWMNGISGLMCLSKYLILQHHDARHIDPSFVPQHSFIIF